MTLTQIGEELWGKLAPLFDEDDGALYAIRVVADSEEAVLNVARLLEQRTSVSGVAVWNRSAGIEVRVDTLTEATQGIVSGLYDPTHVLLTDLRVGDITVPPLGVLMLPGELVLDYRKGPGWSADTLAAFFSLLQRIVDDGHNVRVALPDVVLPKWHDAFSAGLNWFCLEHTPG
jgi:hypothetical protein